MVKSTSFLKLTIHAKNRELFYFCFIRKIVFAFESQKGKYPVSVGINRDSAFLDSLSPPSTNQNPPPGGGEI